MKTERSRIFGMIAAGVFLWLGSASANAMAISFGPWSGEGTVRDWHFVVQETCTSDNFCTWSFNVQGDGDVLNVGLNFASLVANVLNYEGPDRVAFNTNSLGPGEKLGRDPFSVLMGFGNKGFDLPTMAIFNIRGFVGSSLSCAELTSVGVRVQSIIGAGAEDSANNFTGRCAVGVPEPMPLALLAIGLLGFVVSRRFSRKGAA